MRRKWLVAVAANALVVVAALPAGAITRGQVDGTDHPQVAQLLFYVPDAQDPRFNDPGSWFSCSGTLLSSTVLLTAGHCTYGVGDDGVSTTSGGGDGDGGTDIWVSFSPEPDFDILPPSLDFAPDHNDLRYLEWEQALDNSLEWTRGTAHPHHDYIDAAFFLYDAGVVVLDSPVDEGDVDPADYGQLPTLGQLDELATRRGPDKRFTVVGYGLTTGHPFYIDDGVRQNATVMLVDIRSNLGLPEDTLVLFSNNAGRHATGGTCFGDSGGPTFDDDSTTVVAVTSFGFSQTCTGVGGGYRIDQQDDLDFINGWL